ncbi:MAG TPA: DMT family transporter [Amaricoccus sp.]|nr:DMT family transporter [Amaricoccus sp.]
MQGWISGAHPFRGPLFMMLSTCSYVINDTLMKLATEGLPPYEVLVLRGLAAMAWGLPLVLLAGFGRQLALMFEGRVVVRNLCETAGILCYILALAQMPIADVSALTQLTPLLVILGASALLGERIGGLRAALIGCGFIGAVMVAQPTGAGVSVYALLAIANAVFGAARDLAGRRVGPEVPGLVVALSATLIVLLAAGAAHLTLEAWVAPGGRHLLLMAGAGLFLMFGHFFIFMAYRVGPTRVVAPFYYTFTVWAVISGLLVFGHLPTPVAIGGIVLVVASGIAAVLLDGLGRRERPEPVG